MPDHFGKISIQQPASPAPQSPPRRPSKQPRPPSSRKPAKKKTHSRSNSLVWFLLLVLVFTVYNVAGFVGIPYYVTTILPKTIYEKTGLIFQTQNVEFNPLTFVFSAKNSKLLSKDETLPDLLKIKSFQIKLKPLSLLRNDLVSEGLTIEELEAHITRKTDGSYFFSSLFHSSQQDDPAKIIDFSDLPFQFSLNNIAISNSKVILSDLPLKKKHSIEDIQFALPTFSNFPLLTGKASVGKKGHEKHKTDLSCDIHSLNLPLYFGYLPFKLPFDFSKGKADGKIGLTFNPKGEKGKKLAIIFDLKIRDAELSTHDNSIKITTPATHLTGTLNPVSKYIHLKTISTRDPIISSFGKSFTSNIRNIFCNDIKLDPAETAVTVPTIGIDLVIVDGGRLRLFDEIGSAKLRTSWNSIQFSLKNYSSAVLTGKKRQPGTFRLTGDQKGEPATFSWQGKLVGTQLLDGSLSINNIQTSTLFQTFGITPFISSKGIADLKGRLRLKLAGSNPSIPPYHLTDATISIQNFTLLEKKSTVLSTPILTLSQFSNSEKQTDFGDISINNGVLKLIRERLPESFSLFATGKYQVHTINFSGKATLLANKSSSKLYFPDITLKAKALNLSEKTKNNTSIIAKSSNGSGLKAVGSVSLTPFNATFKTEFNRLQSNTLFPWFTNLPFLTNMTGFVSGNGIFTLPKTGFVGQLSIDQVSFPDKIAPVLGWEKSTFGGLNFSSRPFHLGIVSAELISPSFSWNITPSDNSPIENFTHFLKKQFPFSYKKNQTKKNITIASFDVQEILVKKGRIQVKEQRMSPVWQGSITQLAGKITDIHSARTSVKSQFKLSGKLDDSLFTVEGESDFFSKEKNGSFSFNLSDFPIAGFYDQLTSLTDIDTSKGTFSVTQNSQWEDNALSSSGSVIFKGIEPESQTSESTLPLALLTNDENTFSLDFSFTEQEPTSSSVLLDKMIARFNKLIIKSSVSPLLLAAGDFTDLIGNEFAEFKAGEDLLTRKGSKTVARYSALLATNPNIALSISGHFDRTIDTAAMKKILETAEAERVTAINRKRFKKWQEQKKAYAEMFEKQKEKLLKEGKIAEQDIPPKFLQEFIPVQAEKIIVTEAMLTDLADKRVSVVYQYFTNQLTLETERIIITEPKPSSSANYGQSRGVPIKIIPLKVRY